MTTQDTRLPLDEIPGPRSLPVIGNVFDIDTANPLAGVVRMAAEYGPIFKLATPGGVRLFVSGPDLVEEICDDARFDKKVTGGLLQLREAVGSGLFTAKTDDRLWRRAHNILMAPFSLQAMRDYMPKMLEIADQLVDKWARLNPGEEVDVPADMTRLTLDTIALCGFGYRFDSFHRDTPHPFVEAMVRTLAESRARARRLPIQTRLNIRARRRAAGDQAFLNDLVDRIIAERRAAGDAADRTDLLGRMLTGVDEQTGERLPDENIRAQCITFLIAAHETTSGLLSFAIYSLLNHPGVMQRARAEVDEVLGRTGAPTFEQVQQLTYVRQVLDETLRLWPTAPGFTRQPYQDTVIGGRYAVPAGTPITVLSQVLHRDTTVWGADAAEFNPDHMAPDRLATISPNNYKPFGTGQRACIGRQFALQEAVLVLGMLLQRFEFIDHLDHQRTTKTTLAAQPDEFHIQLRPRQGVPIDRPVAADETGLRTDVAESLDLPDVAESLDLPATPARPARPQPQPQPAPGPPAERSQPPPPASTQPEQGSGWVVPLCVLVVGSFMSVLDSSIVNIAIPKMMTALSASADHIEWVVTGYTLVLGVVVPLSGWLGLRIGLTRLHVMSMLGFALGSALCGFAWNLSSMIAFRVLQAIPGGVLPVVTLTLLYQIVPRSMLGKAMGLYGLGVVVAPAIGPTLGGALVEYFDWRLIFFINVPIGLVGMVLAGIVLPQTRPTSWPKLDILGFLTIGYALFAVLLAFSEGQDWGWTGYRVLGLFVSAALSLALFVIIENEVQNPLIDLRIFRSFAFCVSLVLIGIAITGLFSALYFLPQFLQQVQGLQELPAGLVLLPGALVLVALTPIAGRIYDLVGPRYPAMIGLLVVALGSYLMAHITVDTPRGDIERWLVIRNIGVGLCLIPIITAGVSSLPTALTSAGSSVNNVVQRLASSIAVAVFGNLNASKGAQMLTDRGALAGLDPYAAGHILGPAAGLDQPEQATPRLLGIYQALTAEITTQTYANGFFVVAILGVAGAVLALFMRSGRQGGGQAVVEL